MARSRYEIRVRYRLYNIRGYERARVRSWARRVSAICVWRARCYDYTARKPQSSKPRFSEPNDCFFFFSLSLSVRRFVKFIPRLSVFRFPSESYGEKLTPRSRSYCVSKRVNQRERNESLTLTKITRILLYDHVCRERIDDRQHDLFVFRRSSDYSVNKTKLKCRIRYRLSSKLVET